MSYCPVYYLLRLGTGMNFLEMATFLMPISIVSSDWQRKAIEKQPMLFNLSSVIIHNTTHRVKYFRYKKTCHFPDAQATTDFKDVPVFLLQPHYETLHLQIERNHPDLCPTQHFTSSLKL
jgi:hypothetical protein